ASLPHPSFPPRRRKPVASTLPPPCALAPRPLPPRYWLDAGSTAPPRFADRERAMNILATAPPRLGIEVVHDLVCPWCFLGQRRLQRTLRRRPELQYELTWRPFLLNPDMPRSGMPRSE